jgi:hypothetical protein
MSAVMTMKEWMHGHLVPEHHWGMRAGVTLRHLVYGERFWWLVLAAAILIVFAILAVYSYLLGTSPDWFRPVPTMLYPYPYMV